MSSKAHEQDAMYKVDDNQLAYKVHDNQLAYMLSTYASDKEIVPENDSQSLYMEFVL
jgi:hypothetical protein